eukprot:9470704-Pyramimonas_sp.AAC.1
MTWKVFSPRLQELTVTWQALITKAPKSDRCDKPSGAMHSGRLLYSASHADDAMGSKGKRLRPLPEGFWDSLAARVRFG